MGFENPAYLWGAAAAAIPLVLHLIMRRRARVHDFAAVEFILLSNKKIARKLRLKQWLLLLFRMLLIAALPIAFAKPYLVLGEEPLPATGAGAPVSVVLVVDTSFSMSYQVGELTLLDRALARAEAIISDLSPESDAAVVVATSPAKALTHRLTYDRRQLRDALDSIELSHATADMQGALRLAEQILVASGQPLREVVVLTDLQASEWDHIRRPWSLEHSPHVTLVDVRDGAEALRNNTAIVGVVAEPQMGASGRDVLVTVEVMNDQPQSFEDIVTVRVGEKTAKGIVKVPPRQRATKEFNIRLPEVGTASGVVEIPPDALPGDNKQPFVIDFLRRVHVLVVNGSPRTVPHRDETFFLRAALRTARESGSRMNPTYVKPDELTPAQLAYVDVVILANVTELEGTQVTALESWVRRGGGLLVTSGENVAPRTYNTVMRPLIPLPVRDVKSAGDKPQFLTGIETSHAALSVFASLPDASIFTAPINRYVLLETAAAPDTEVLMSYTDGAPALVQRRLEAGRVLMLTTTVDRDWTDLPFKTSYLPLVQQLILYLSARLDQHRASSLVVGDARTISVGRDVNEIEINRPDGRQVRFTGADLAVGEVRFHDTELAGIYTVRQRRRQGAEEQRFAVNVDPKESALVPADRETVERVLQSGRKTPGAAVNEPTAQSAPQRRGNLWPMLLLSLFVLLCAETWLAYQAS